MTQQVDDNAGVRVAWLIELLQAAKIEHVDGCMGQAECAQCVIEDVDRALREPACVIGGRRFP